MTESSRTKQGSAPETKSERTRRSLLNAAASVIQTDGVANLTLERVAAAAQVSKGGLLYHYGTKQDLLNALLEDTLRRADDGLEELATESERDHGAFAHAYLDFVRSRSHRDDTAAGVLAAAALDEGDLTIAQRQFANWQQRLLDRDGLDETAALLARVVGDGLWLIDLFDLAPPDDRQRAALLDHVADLVERSHTSAAAARQT